MIDRRFQRKRGVGTGETVLPLTAMGKAMFSFENVGDVSKDI